MGKLFLSHMARVTLLLPSEVDIEAVQITARPYLFSLDNVPEQE